MRITIDQLRRLIKEETVAYLRNWASGAPLWKFEILRDPDIGLLYAYYEMDTSN